MVIMGSSVLGRVSRCRPAWRKCMINTIRLVSTIKLLVCQRLTPLVSREHVMSHFFAYLSRMKFIKRWGLMHNTYPENIQEHSLRVAMIAHALALIRNRVFAGAVNPERTAVLALYHDASEVLTGDL